MSIDEASKTNRDNEDHQFYQPGAQAIPKMDPNWVFRNNIGEGQLSHFRNIFLQGIQAASKKTMNWNKIQEISQDPKENSSTFLERLKECL